MPVFNNILAGSSGQSSGYDIDQSLRFDDGDSAYLSRTPGSASNQKTWTWSSWVKRSNLSAYQNFFDAHTDNNNRLYLAFNASDKLEIYGTNSASNILVLSTTAVYRDVGAWYHIVFQLDTTQAVAANRARLYVNGEQVTVFDTATYPAQDTDLHVNSTVPHRISSYAGGSNYYDGYLAEVYFIDGTALDASSFGETDAATNQWKPIEATGLTYGTNGFYQKYSSTELANSFTDSSSSAHTITNNGSVSNTVAKKKVGRSSISFSGSNRLTITDSDGISGNDNYTLEAWVYVSDTVNSGGEVFISVGDTRSTKSIVGLGFLNGGAFRVWHFADDWAPGTSITAGQWNHIALTYDGTTETLWVNGSDAGNRSAGTFSLDGLPVVIGAQDWDGAGSYPLTGWMDEIRISDSARYTTTFTPSTTAFTADANTKLLIHSDFDGGLGADSSGNKNDFTPTNLVATDVVIDTPTNNFATLNPLLKWYGSQTYSEGNLKINNTSGYNANVSTIGASSGKWYFEFRVGASSQSIGVIGNKTVGWWDGSAIYPQDASGVFVYYGNGRVNIDGTYANTLTSFTDDDIIGTALNLDDSEITFYKNGVVQNSGVAIALSGDITNSSVFNFGMVTYVATAAKSGWANFGQDSSFAGTETAQGNGGTGEDFYYTPPTGYKALNTDNMSNPAIADPTKHFNTVLYDGGDVTGSVAVTGAGFQPDLVWLKTRVDAYSNQLHDSVRGAASGPVYSDLTNAEDASYPIASFDSDGFSTGTQSSNTGQNADSMVAWNWKAGGTAVSNTDGTITSSVSANPTAGFSAGTYIGNGTAGATVGHGLSVTPEMIIIKNLDDPVAHNWAVYHESVGATAALALNESGAITTSILFFNNTAPTSSVFSIGVGGTNTNTYSRVFYAFNSIEGYSKVGSSYTGNGSADGTFIYTGFKPAYAIFKRTGFSADWVVFDDKRNPYNAVDTRLYPNTSAIESTAGAGYADMDFVSNGIKIRGDSAMYNNSSGPYIFYAVAESPFKYSNAR